MTREKLKTFEQLLDVETQIILILYLLHIPDYPSRIVKNFDRAIEMKIWTHRGKKSSLRDEKTIKFYISQLEKKNIIKQSHDTKVKAAGRYKIYKIIPEILFEGLRVMGSDDVTIKPLKQRYCNRDNLHMLEKNIMGASEPPDVDHRINGGSFNKNISLIVAELIPCLTEANVETDGKLEQNEEKVFKVIKNINNLNKYNYESLLLYFYKMLAPIQAVFNDIRCLEGIAPCGCNINSDSNCWTINAIKNIDNYVTGMQKFFQSMKDVDLNAACSNETLSKKCKERMDKIINDTEIFNLKDLELKLRKLIERELGYQYGDQFSCNKEYPEHFYVHGSIDITRFNFALKAQREWLSSCVLELLSDKYGIIDIKDFYPRYKGIFPDFPEKR